MGEWDDYVTHFWDCAHRRGSSIHLGTRSSFEGCSKYFNLVGPFLEDLKVATSVLDIGPGLGRFLDEIPDKERYAIDVSEVSRERMRGKGIEAFGPGEVRENIVDFATCLSVIQHCDKDATRIILEDAARALRRDGLFYLNGVCGNPKMTKEKALEKGRFPNTSKDVISTAESLGFSLVNVMDYKLAAARAWILKMVRT